jgi:hypothetical protein
MLGMQPLMAKLVHSVRLSIPHVDRVRTPCTIQRPDPSADRARPQRLTTIALAAWGVGVLLTVGLARMHRVPSDVQLSMNAALGQLRPADQQPEPLAIADHTRAEAVVHQTRAPEPPRVASAGQVTAAVSKPQPIASAPPQAAPKPPSLSTQAPAPNRRHAKRVFVQGTVAYVHCGSPHARTACLRDRKFEEQVWQMLAKLPSCSEGDPGTGSAELRWTLYKSDPSAFDWRPGLDGTSLNFRAVAKCAAEKLATTRTRLRAQQAVLSFRFSLK